MAVRTLGRRVRVGFVEKLLLCWYWGFSFRNSLQRRVSSSQGHLCQNSVKLVDYTTKGWLQITRNKPTDKISWYFFRSFIMVKISTKLYRKLEHQRKQESNSQNKAFYLHLQVGQHLYWMYKYFGQQKNLHTSESTVGSWSLSSLRYPSCGSLRQESRPTTTFLGGAQTQLYLLFLSSEI